MRKVRIIYLIQASLDLKIFFQHERMFFLDLCHGYSNVINLDQNYVTITTQFNDECSKINGKYDLDIQIDCMNEWCTKNDNKHITVPFGERRITHGLELLYFTNYTALFTARAMQKVELCSEETKIFQTLATGTEILFFFVVFSHNFAINFF